MTTSYVSDGNKLLNAVGTALSVTHTALSICAVIFLLSLVVLDYFSDSWTDNATESKYKKVVDSGITAFYKRRPSTSLDEQQVNVIRGMDSNIQNTRVLEAELATIDATFDELQIRREQLLRIIADRRDSASQIDANTIVMMEPEVNR